MSHVYMHWCHDLAACGQLTLPDLIHKRIQRQGYGLYLQSAECAWQVERLQLDKSVLLGVGPLAQSTVVIGARLPVLGRVNAVPLRFRDLALHKLAQSVIAS